MALERLAPTRPRFILDRAYTRTQIHDRLGGSKVSCLPTRQGRIVAACLSTAFSPRAPRVMLCGQGARTGPASALLVRHAGPLPVFLKRAVNQWNYQGLFKVVESYSSGARFECYIEGSGRAVESVSHVVLFEPVTSNKRYIPRAPA